MHDGLVSVLAVPKMCVQFVVTVVTVAQETSRVDCIGSAPRNLRTGFVRSQEVSGVGLLSIQ